MSTGLTTGLAASNCTSHEELCVIRLRRKRNVNINIYIYIYTYIPVPGPALRPGQRPKRNLKPNGLVEKTQKSEVRTETQNKLMTRLGIMSRVRGIFNRRSSSASARTRSVYGG